MIACFISSGILAFLTLRLTKVVMNGGNCGKVNLNIHVSFMFVCSVPQ